MQIVVDAKEVGLGAISYELSCIDIPTPEGEGYQFGKVIIHWSNGATGNRTAITVMRGDALDISAVASCDVYVDGEFTDTWDLDSATFYEETEPAAPPTPPGEDEPKFSHPGSFLWYNFARDIIICSPAGLTAEKVGLWCDHCDKWLSYQQQLDCTGTADECRVSSGDLITADWYNRCADLCGVANVAKDDLITADLLKALGAAIS